MINGKGLKGMLVLSSLICMLLFISIELKAEDQPKTQKSGITQTEGTKLQDITIIKEPMRRVPPEGKPNVPHIKTVRPDLTCRIHAYYDQQRKMPIQSGVYYCSSWHPDSARIYFDVEVKNIGNAKAENFVVKIRFIITGERYFYEKASLESGEAVVFPYYCDYIDTKKVKDLTVESWVDPGSKIEESNKDNNYCKLRVRFVPPQSPSKEMKPVPGKK